MAAKMNPFYDCGLFDMRIHADFSQAIIIPPEEHQWVKSPGGEVNRMMLDRIGEEKARATSLVEFVPGSRFPAHNHPLGEEVLVLSGIFTEDEHLDYPEGWYMRNPHQSAHRVSSEPGCRIFVKLMQMTDQELEPRRIDTHNPKNWLFIDERHLCPLYESEVEKTFLEKLAADQVFIEPQHEGIELLILAGALWVNDKHYPTGTWMRLPQNILFSILADASGATVYVKRGHLQHTMDVWEQPEAKL